MPFAKLPHCGFMVGAAPGGDFLARLADCVCEKEDIHQGVKVSCANENGVGASLACDDERAVRFVYAVEARGEIVPILGEGHDVLGKAGTAAGCGSCWHR